MAQAIKTVYTYNLDGTKKDFNIPFEYLARKFIRVTLIGKDRKILVLNQDYRFSTKTTITTTQAWGQAQGYNLIEVRRYTSATERLVDYTDGSILRAYDLNISQLQTIHVAEEARDLTADTIGVNNNGDLDARGRRIVNLVDAVNDRDAVPLGQLKGLSQGAWNARNQAEQFKNQAKGFRDEAEVSRNAAEAAKARAGAAELKAKDWAIKENAAVEGDQWSSKHYSKLTANDRAASFQSKEAAEKAKLAAETAQRHAANSQAAAATSATGAKKEADRAKAEADKLGNINAFAGAIDNVSGLNVTFKGIVASLNELRSAYANGLRIAYGNYGVILRNDGASTYFLLTNSGNKFGDFNSLRPFRIDNATGRVDLGHGSVIRGKLQAEDVGCNYIGNTGQYYSAYSWGGGLAQQLNTNGAFAQRLPGNQDSNVYYPLVKTFGRRSNGYPTAISFGAVAMGQNAFHQAAIHLIGDNGQGYTYLFDITGNFTVGTVHARTQVNVGNSVLQSDGNIKGGYWGTTLVQWLRDNTVNKIQMGAAQASATWNAAGVADGGGKVLTGAYNNNKDAFIDGVQWRVMQFIRNNGTAYNIY